MWKLWNNKQTTVFYTWNNPNLASSKVECTVTSKKVNAWSWVILTAESWFCVWYCLNRVHTPRILHNIPVLPYHRRLHCSYPMHLLFLSRQQRMCHPKRPHWLFQAQTDQVTKLAWFGQRVCMHFWDDDCYRFVMSFYWMSVWCVACKIDDRRVSCFLLFV